MMATNEKAIASLENSITMTDETLHPLLHLAEQRDTVFNQGSAGWLKELRVQGAYKVAHSTFPTRRDEDWRVTNISLVKDTEFILPETIQLTGSDIASELMAEATHRLVFVNGQFAKHLSQTDNLPEGLTVSNLANLTAVQAETLINYLGKNSRELDVFASLNHAGFQDVAVIWAEKDVIVNEPIQILFIHRTGSEAIALQTRCLAIASPFAKFSFVEQHIAQSTNETTYFNNALTEIFVQDSAEINHVRIQRESTAAAHIANTVVAQAENGRYQINEINLGGKVSRHTLTIKQTGAQTETTLKGLALLDGEQICDTHSDVQLNHPHGTVDQLHKCIVDGSACSIFNGKVAVPQAAQMTNAAQLNRNLLLSPKARVDTKPELEITADNVKCAHGATVSQLEPDEIFYLRSRGLDDMAARSLLVDAFATEIVGAIAIPSLVEKISAEFRA